MSKADDKKKRTCQKEACAIQDCLEKRGYDEERCRDYIERMRRCCKEIAYDSFICHGFDPERNASKK